MLAFRFITESTSSFCWWPSMDYYCREKEIGSSHDLCLLTYVLFVRTFFFCSCAGTPLMVQSLSETWEADGGGLDLSSSSSSGGRRQSADEVRQLRSFG